MSRIADDGWAGDEGRSSNYDAEEPNTASESVVPQDCARSTGIRHKDACCPGEAVTSASMQRRYASSRLAL